MSISLATQTALKSGSWIRRMFEQGNLLKLQHGADQVFDFSLGNPLLEPPAEFVAALRDLAAHPKPGSHRYMPNNGFASTRQALAKKVSAEQHVALDANDIVMTVGAAGAINVACRSLLDPGDEVIVLAPYFVEYLSYAQLHGGVPVVVETRPDFSLDIDAITRAITARTKLIFVNTPNNPTGKIYTAQEMKDLGQTLAKAQKKHGRDIYILHDTPYAKLTFDGKQNPPLFADHPNTLIAHSYSKELGLAGERIGFLAIHPAAPHRVAIRDAATFNNRVLGFVNAPALMQLCIERALDASVDIAQYVALRQTLVDGLKEIGFQFTVPDGGFYLFPQTPIADDVKFTEILAEEKILVVPGRGFGRSGHVRMAFCVEPWVISKALPGFTRAFQKARASKP